MEDEKKDGSEQEETDELLPVPRDIRESTESMAEFISNMVTFLRMTSKGFLTKKWITMRMMSFIMWLMKPRIKSSRTTLKT